MPKLGYVIVYVPDVAKALAFYERAFGLARQMVHEHEYGELATGATSLAFVVETMRARHGLTTHDNRPAPALPAGIEIAFVVDDVAAAHATALAAGAVQVTAPERKPWGQVVSYVRDLNGDLVELCSPMQASGDAAAAPEATPPASPKKRARTAAAKASAPSAPSPKKRSGKCARRPSLGGGGRP